MGLSNYVPSSRVSQAGVCTSTTRPASPYEGQMIYETDTDEIRVWTGASWLSIPAYAFSKVSGAGTISSTGVLSLSGTSYITATYSSGWGKYPAGVFADASYGKTSTGVVLLNGLIRRTSGSDPVAFYLPSGYRPASTIIYGVAGSGGIGRIDVNADGSVYWVGTIAGSVNIADWISLGGISFFAA